MTPHEIVQQTIAPESEIRGVSLESFRPRRDPWVAAEVWLLRLLIAGVAVLCVTQMWRMPW